MSDLDKIQILENCKHSVDIKKLAEVLQEYIKERKNLEVELHSIVVSISRYMPILLDEIKPVLNYYYKKTNTRLLFNQEGKFIKRVI